jgi:hypothetical protein
LKEKQNNIYWRDTIMMLKTDDNKIAPDECANCIMPQCAICKYNIDSELRSEMTSIEERAWEIIKHDKHTT